MAKGKSAFSKIPITETEQAVLDIINSRHKLGRKRYGKGISYKQAKSLDKWLTEAIEEAADLLQYLVAMKVRMEKDKNAKILSKRRQKKIRGNPSKN